MMGWRIFVFCAVVTGLFGTLLFGAAGRLDVPTFWVYLAAWVVYIAGSKLLTERINPDLARERAHSGADRDPLTRRLVAVPALGHFVVAGLDVGRFGWSSVPWPLQVTAFVVMSAGMGFVAWTFVANRFASSTVCIQAERGQTVIDTGPYAIVRHPMYLGTVLVALGSGVALGSWWAALLVAFVVPIFVRRTRFEDRMLHEELPGYREYAQRTRWRLAPGLL